MNATISADLVSSTSLSISEVVMVKDKLESLFEQLQLLYTGFWGRVVKGDTIECYVPNPTDALRIALLIKTRLKSLDVESSEDKKSFQIYGARMEIGLGSMRIVNRSEDVMDGEAIYQSGRKLDEMGTPVKGTLQAAFTNKWHGAVQAVCVLVDAILNNATQRQCRVVYYKLLSKNENEIAVILNISQSSVNQRSTSAQWYAIDSALKFYEQINWKQNEHDSISRSISDSSLG